MNSIHSLLPLLSGGAGTTGGQDGGTALLSLILPFGLIFVVFYFLIIRPQNKKQKEAKKMMEALKKGDKVQTIGGLRGTIWQVKEDSIIIKADDNVKLEFVRSAISNVLEQKPVDAKAEASDETDEDSSDAQKK